MKRKQRGLSVTYLLGFLALAFIVASASAKMFSASAPSASRLYALENARELVAAGKTLNVEIATLRLTHGASIDIQIVDGVLSSPSGAFASRIAPSTGGSASNGWSMAAADRLVVSGESLLVAITTTTAEACSTYNSISLRGSTAPVVTSSANGAGGLDYSLSNASSVNGGLPATTFCDKETNRVLFGVK